jgi:phosphopantetheine--protein transferase-like protein
MNAIGFTVCDPPADVQSTSGLSRLWDAPIARLRQPPPPGPGLVCCRLDALPLDPDRLAHLLLSPGEWEFWRQMRAVNKRRHEWLLGRAVAKDAVRRLVEEHAGARLAPADIEIRPDPYGRPEAVGPFAARLGIQPVISISHSHGTAVALAALCSGQLVGIDLENLARRREDFEAIAFSPDERRMLAAMPRESQQEWALRMWCAKEAVAKALGRGFSMGIQAFHITSAETRSGVLQLELCDTALEHFPRLRGRSIMAYTGREEDFVFSTTIHQGAVE